jgi:hypothetical protein
MVGDQFRVKLLYGEVNALDLCLESCCIDKHALGPCIVALLYLHVLATCGACRLLQTGHLILFV